jgi:hypothetical protein
MKLIVKYFYLADILFLGVILDLNKYTFPLQMCFSSYFTKQYHTKTFQMQVAHAKEICS